MRLRDRRGSATIILALIASLLFAAVSVTFKYLNDMRRKGIYRSRGTGIARDANGSAIDIANLLVRSGNVKGYLTPVDATRPHASTFWRWEPQCPTIAAGSHVTSPCTVGSVTLTEGYPRDSGYSPAARIDVVTCNGQALSFMDFDATFSDDPKLPSVCHPLSTRLAIAKATSGGAAEIEAVVDVAIKVADGN